MDNTREKLIELLESAESAIYWDSSDKGFIEKIADHLIANGVTFATDNNDGHKTGHWIIKHIKNSEYKFSYCSECLTDGSPKWKVCPVCETKMVGVLDV